MAPSTSAAAKPKRKRQRRRREVSESSSSSSSDSESEEEVAPPPKLPTPSASSSESSSDSSSSDESSSEDERARRKGKGKGGAQTAAATAAVNGKLATRPYPARSPSPPLPRTIDPANLPLGQSIFPLLKPLDAGKILEGKVPGDAGFEAESSGEGVAKDEEKEREDKFGEWWRARLVNEFESELGSLAAEPGLTAPRLELLLTSLTSLSTLHTTSSSKAAATRSIWLHDPSTSIDPLASINDESAVVGEDWGKSKIGGQGDVEVGEEGVAMDLKTSSGGGEMEVDEQ